jgi:pyruvate kinase
LVVAESRSRSGVAAPAANDSIDALIAELERIEADLRAATDRAMPQIEGVSPHFRRSALNLVQYLALRRHDVRPLQTALSAHGLSSLGRSEAHIQTSVESVLGLLYRLAERTRTSATATEPAIGFREGEALLAAHTQALLGPPPVDRRVRIMVTAPTEAADDFVFMRNLLASGMDCLRINCAHDDPGVWARMIANLRRAERDLGRTCRVMMDLAGPKLRTGPLEPGPQTIKWRPRRDDYGRVLAPARIWLTPEESPRVPPVATDAALPLPTDWLATLAVGDIVTFTDTRRARRRLRIIGGAGGSWWAECDKTAYVATGTRLRRRATEDRPTRSAAVGSLPPRPSFLTLSVGDPLVVMRGLEPGRAATVDERGRPLTPARIGCTLPEVFSSVRSGERIWFDDGKIGGIVKAVETDRLLVEITQARPTGSRLRAEKGINLPDTDLRVSALTDKDVEDLRFVAANADLIGLSFVREPSDVERLRARLAELGSWRPGIVLKIETRRAFQHLPQLLLAVMRNPSAGIMIARGDLAVEAGYERLAEVQEEILWIAEAAHVPVIWATQVLETLAQTGMPSRSEITDAAMGERAECVMLNKGPYVVAAVRVLDDILRRMQDHQQKKRSLLRRLRSWSSGAS